MSADILETGDGTLEDWELPLAICDGGGALRPERWNPWRHGTIRFRITAVPGNPPKLPIDGHEYHRRQKARRRRRRR